MKKKCNFVLTDKAHDALKEMAKNNQVTMSMFLNILLENSLPKNFKLFKK